MFFFFPLARLWSKTMSHFMKCGVAAGKMESWSIYFLTFLPLDFWLYYGIISTLKIVENSEEKAVKDHTFNPLLASYFNVNYLSFLFLSVLKKEEIQTCTLLTMPSMPALHSQAWSANTPHGWWARSHQTLPGKALILLFVMANLAKPTPTQVWYNIDSTPYPVRKNVFS